MKFKMFSSLSRYCLIVHSDSARATNRWRNYCAAFAVAESLGHLGLNARLSSLRHHLWPFLNRNDRGLSKYDLIFSWLLSLELLVYLLHNCFCLLLCVVRIE